MNFNAYVDILQWLYDFLFDFSLEGSIHGLSESTVPVFAEISKDNVHKNT
jgi:hypothetical protein